MCDAPGPQFCGAAQAENERLEAVVEAAKRLDWENVVSALNAFDLFLEKFSVVGDERLTAEMKRISERTASCPPGELMQIRIREFAAALEAYETEGGGKIAISPKEGVVRDDHHQG
jgi:hypothetical protein